MNCLPHTLLWIVLLASGNLILPPAVAQPVAGGPAQVGLVVLENGNVVRGNIRLLEDHYRVEFPGGELRVKVKHVEMFCKDLDQAYQQRRENRTATSADAHLELARWCMRYDLHDQAARELEDARSIDSEHRKLPQLDRQLKQLVKLAARTRLTNTVVSPSPEEVAQQQQLDEKILKKAPQWARVLFVRQVQPMLVHSCATAGCHQPGSSQENFQLDRLAIDAAGHPHVTQHNLAATLAQIDWDAPEQSQLLQQAHAAHGKAEKTSPGPLPPHKMKLLKMWVEQLATVHRAQTEIDLLASKRDKILPDKTATPPLEKMPEKVQLTGYTQQDPFDAAFFNSRYGQKPATEAPTDEQKK